MFITDAVIRHRLSKKKEKKEGEILFYLRPRAAKVNEIYLDLVTVLWLEDTKEICDSKECLAGKLDVKTRVGVLRNRDERCVSPRAYRTMI